MKKLLLMLSTALMLTFTGCMQFDDTRIWDAIDELEDLYDNLDGRLEKLEEECEKMNTNIEALQTLVSALQSQDTITTIAPIKQGDKVVGYTISFSKSEPITIYHGEDGKDGADGEDGKDGANGSDGYTPTIGVAKDADENYYWTLDGEWLLDAEGNKIKANGNDGKDGADGENGANGEDGKDGENGENGADGEDGITPKLEIRDGYWYISYDNGQSWVELGKATGEDGKDGANGADGADGEDGKDGENGKDGADGDSLFQSVTWDEEYAYFTLADGTVITIPLSDGAVTKTVEVNAVEMIGLCADNLCMFVLTDSGFNHEAEYWGDAGWMSFNSEYYVIGLVLETIDDSSVVPQGTFTSESGEIDIRDGSYYEYLGDDWDDSYDYNFDNAVVIVSEDKIEATFTLENGEVHHVIYEGSLELYFKGITDKEEDNEDGDLPPANEIWYTSTDGEVVTPYNAYAFGVNILSNTYKNGVGIITFDGDVTSIGDCAFAFCESLASVTISDSVTSIGNMAFKDCTSLTSITIPDSVTSIGDSAFAVCTSLESVTIPDSVTSIREWAFSFCESLTSVYCKAVTPPAGGSGMFDHYAWWERKIYVPTESVEAYKSAAYWSEYANYIEPYNFGGGEELVVTENMKIYYTSTDGEVVTPNATDVFGANIISNTYENGKGVITFDGDVTSIGDDAFYCRYSLTSVTIPESVTSIGEDAFSNCTSLTSVTIPDSVTSIGEGAISGCTSLKSIYGKYASNDGRYLIIDGVLNSFAPAGLTEYTIPDSVTSIGDYAFCACSSLASVTIPDSVTSIGMLAFSYCTSLTSITIPDSVTKIREWAFSYCTSLTSVTIGNGVTYIGGYAFYGCTSLTSITIPDSVTQIGNGVFEDCTSLTNVYCKATTPPVGSSSMFYNNASGRKIYVPTESVDAYKAADDWSDHADYIEPYNFGGGEGNAGVKEVAAVSLFGFYYEIGYNFYLIGGYVSSGEDVGYDVPMDSWNYGFDIISDTEPVNDEIPLGTYTYVDFEKLESGEEELKTGIFTKEVEGGKWCMYVDANGEMQEYKYTEGTMVVSEGKIELTVTLDNGEVHHVVYEGSLQTWGEAA